MYLYIKWRWNDNNDKNAEDDNHGKWVKNSYNAIRNKEKSIMERVMIKITSVTDKWK